MQNLFSYRIFRAPFSILFISVIRLKDRLRLRIIAIYHQIYRHLLQKQHRNFWCLRSHKSGHLYAANDIKSSHIQWRLENEIKNKSGKVYLWTARQVNIHIQTKNTFLNHFNRKSSLRVSSFYILFKQL